MSELFLLVRPPRPLWPLSGPHTGFWPPLAFASLAAALRDRVRHLRVEILDAPILRMGWRSLAEELRRRRPDYVGLGEEAVSCVEALRLARLAHELPARVVAGGCFFGHVAAEVLATGLIDVVVHGEGEHTLVELVEAWRSGKPEDLRGVRGISYRDQDQVVSTPPRPLIEHLDDLPWPAYDLLPMERYGPRSRNHPQLATIELGRGCVGACAFCVLWRQMGRYRNGQATPCLRVKSPERLLAEIDQLYHRYHRRYLGWVDPCFNAHPNVPGRLAEQLLRRGWQLGQSAWVRADGLLRDADSGALRHCVAAGLNEVYLGIERAQAADLAALHKTTDLDQCRAALRGLRARHPEVFTIGSFIYGLPGDTPNTVRSLFRLSLELELDKAFFIPLTPLPGTPYWRPELWDLTGERFRRFDFLPPTLPPATRPDLDWALARSFALDWPVTRWRGYWRGFTSANRRRRRLTWRLFLRATHYAARLAIHTLRGNHAHGAHLNLPRWYEH